MTEKNIFKNLLLEKNIIIFPNMLNRNIENSILTKLSKKYEGKCTTEGFIKNESIKIFDRSIGRLSGSNFRGTVEYKILFSADICNPVNGELIKCTVLNINRLGVLAENGPLSIIIPKDYHEDKSVFKKIEVNDVILVEVVGKRFEINDTKISVIGRLAEDSVKNGDLVKIKKIKRDKKKINVDEISDMTDDSDTESEELYSDVDSQESGEDEDSMIDMAEENEEEMTDDLMDDNSEMQEKLVELGEDDSDPEYLIEEEEGSEDFTYEK